MPGALATPTSTSSEHEAAVVDHAVFGVPTFIAGDQAAFVRLMTRPAGDQQAATDTIERILTLLTDQTDLNELNGSISTWTTCTDDLHRCLAPMAHDRVAGRWYCRRLTEQGDGS